MLEENVSAHFAGERTACFLHFGLDEAVSRFPHQGFTAQFGYPVVERLAGLHIRDNGGTGKFFQHRLSEDGKQLIAPDNPALAVDRSDPVAVTVESHAEIELFLRDERFEVGQVLFFGGIGMMVGKITVDFGEQQMMLTRQQLDQFFDDWSGRAIARVPAHAAGRAHS